MEIIKAILLGIIQGITEWLPISSTGHMILADEWIQLSGGKEFVGNGTYGSSGFPVLLRLKS